MAPYVDVCAQSADHVSKLGLGNQDYSLTWIDNAILVQCKLEAATFSLYLEEYANLGMLEEQIVLIKKILAPFTSANFINTVL